MLIKHYMNLQDYIDFIGVSIKRTQSPLDYFKFQRLQGKFLIKYFASVGMEINDFCVLDLANGFGGETIELNKLTKNVVGLDLNIVNKSLSVNQVSADALLTPFKENTFDLIICASLIEHLEKPGKLLNEIFRILKPNGFLYLSFPPFYSINGGHDYAPFHLLGEKSAVILSRLMAFILKRKKFGQKLEISTQFKSAYGNWGLYEMSIKKAKALIINCGFEILNQSTKWIPIDFSKIPLFGEFLTWHVQFLVVKDSKNV